jgi:hypothetical protein
MRQDFSNRRSKPEALVNPLESISFPELASRISARYIEGEDALIVVMLGQEYTIRHDGVYLHGQRAPEAHTTVLLNYLFSSGTTFLEIPWRPIGDFSGASSPEFRKKVELPITSYATEIIARANVLLPMMDAGMVKSLIGSDIAFTVKALPRVYLHVELSQETQDFPAEAWVLFSNNAQEFLVLSNLLILTEVFKDRILSLLRIY